MKGMSILQITMILSVIIAGVFVILMGSVGETPIYYHTLPEIQFSELLSSFIHTEINLKRTMEEDSDRFFDNVLEFPVEWNEHWNSYSNFKRDFEILFGEKLGEAATKYFGSVYTLEGAKVNASIVNVSGSGSKISYDSSTKKLIWNYTYRIYLSSRISVKNAKNEINSTRNMITEFDFMDLEKIYDCVNSSFAKMKKTVYNFQKLNSNELECGLTQWLMNNVSNCKDFEVSLKAPISCKGHNCDCRDMQNKPVKIILSLSQPGKGRVTFSEEFANFKCGQLKNTCTKGSECDGKDCIGVSATLGFCGFCLDSDSACSLQCSPQGSLTSISSGKYRCHKIRGIRKYKCLNNYDNIILTLNDIPISKEINLNCGKKHEILKVNGITNYFFEFNGVKIDAGDLDLCDTTKVPRTDGILIIYSNSNGNNYEVERLYVDFALSEYINKLNNKEFIYNFDNEKCDIFKNNVKKRIENYIKETGIEGYNFIISSLDVKCEKDNPTTWYDEKYSFFKIDFREKSTGKNVGVFKGIVKYEAPY